MNTESRYYCILGKHDYLDDNQYPRTNQDDDRVVAKAVPTSKTKHLLDKKIHYKYFILTSPTLKFFNPIDIHSTLSEVNKTDYISNVCKKDWGFKEVNMMVFKDYIDFLKSKNQRLLKQAERNNT